MESKEIKFTPDDKASEPIFWHAFKELSKNDNNGLVSYDKLKNGKIEKTGDYNVYRIGKSITIKEEGWDDMQ